MTTIPAHKHLPPSDSATPLQGSRRIMGGEERVFYEGYWIKTYPVPADSLLAKKNLIEALTRRLFNQTEHGLNIPGCRLPDARLSYQNETDPARRRVKAAMLAGALFNRAVDILRKLVDLQVGGMDIRNDDPLLRECGQCLADAIQLRHFVLHRSGEDGISELWGEPLRAFTTPIGDFYESRYVKIGQSMRDIDRIANVMVDIFTRIPAFAAVEVPIRAFVDAARLKLENLRTDPDIFDVWAQLVMAAERLASFAPLPQAIVEKPGEVRHDIGDGVLLLRNGRDLIFYIARARTPMPKSTREYIERCEGYLATGRAQFPPPPALPA